MSLTAVRSYLRTVMNEQGHTEWKDGFNFENIPSTVLDGSYHLETQPSSGIKQNQSAIEIDQPLVARLFIKGFLDPASGIDKGIQKSEVIIQQALKPTRRVAQTSGIKNVKITSVSVEPFGESNDNVVIARMEFNFLVVLNHA